MRRIDNSCLFAPAVDLIEPVDQLTRSCDIFVQIVYSCFAFVHSRSSTVVIIIV